MKYIWIFIIFILLCMVFVNFFILYIKDGQQLLKKKQKPKWLSPVSHQILDKKLNKNIDFNDVSLYIMCMLYPKCSTKGLNWKDIENRCIYTSNIIKKHNIDVIVGIKSGGAIIADCIGNKLNIPVQYIKVNKYGEKPFHQRASEFLREHDYNVIVEGNIDVENKQVLLIDDVCFTGATMKISYQYLKKKKAKQIIPICLFGSGYSGKLASVIDNNSYIPLPWSYDP